MNTVLHRHRYNHTRRGHEYYNTQGVGEGGGGEHQYCHTYIQMESCMERKWVRETVIHTYRQNPAWKGGGGGGGHSYSHIYIQIQSCMEGREAQVQSYVHTDIILNGSGGRGA